MATGIAPAALLEDPVALEAMIEQVAEASADAEAESLLGRLRAQFGR